jgi:hypothetical protein
MKAQSASIHFWRNRDSASVIALFDPLFASNRFIEAVAPNVRHNLGEGAFGPNRFSCSVIRRWDSIYQ